MEDKMNFKPYFEKWNEKYKNKGLDNKFRDVFQSIEENEKLINNYLEKNKLNLEMFFDILGDIFEKFNHIYDHLRVDSMNMFLENVVYKEKKLYPFQILKIPYLVKTISSKPSIKNFTFNIAEDETIKEGENYFDEFLITFSLGGKGIPIGESIYKRMESKISNFKNKDRIIKSLLHHLIEDKKTHTTTNFGKFDKYTLLNITDFIIQKTNGFLYLSNECLKLIEKFPKQNKEIRRKWFYEKTNFENIKEFHDILAWDLSQTNYSNNIIEEYKNKLDNLGVKYSNENLALDLLSSKKLKKMKKSFEKEFENIILINTDELLNDWANKAKNCLATYHENIINGEKMVFSIVENDIIHICQISIRKDLSGEYLNLDKVWGIGNIDLNDSVVSSKILKIINSKNGVEEDFDLFDI